MTRISLAVTGGMIVDPASGIYRLGTVFIGEDRILPESAGTPADAERVVDATGCLVTPGLIDHHAHVFHGGTALGISPDNLLPMGVTTVVDAGSTGVDACEAMIRSVISVSRIRVICQLNVSSEGQISEARPETLDPAHFEPDRMARLFERYPGIVRGLKIRCGAEVVGAFGLQPLAEAVKIADALGQSLTVHATNPPCDMSELVAPLRRGDVLCHFYHGRGSTIIGDDGHVKPGVRAARGRGVLFDTADARGNHCYSVIAAALADGFGPDIISTDVTRLSLFGDMVFGLPVVVARYLEHGLGLVEAIRACTAAPAEAIGCAGVLGTLRPGACADVAVFRQIDRPFCISNILGEQIIIKKRLVPQMTISRGNVIFRSADFF